jgi:hypothetical protein
MCTKLTQGELKNCNCKLAQFCKRRQQSQSNETGAAAFFAEDAIDLKSFLHEAAPVYNLIPIASLSATN